MLFVWNASSGRFMSLYYLDEGLEESQIGAIFGVGSITAPFISTLLGIWSDRLMLRSPAGRHWCLGACLIIGTIFFTMQALHIPGVSRFTIMLVCRIVTGGANATAYILATAITVQGMADRKSFGEERLYGAVSWAITHLMLGVMIDVYGRVVQHVLIIVSTILVIISLVVIGVPQMPAHHEGSASPEKKSKGPGLAALGECGSVCALLHTYATSLVTMALFAYSIALGYGMTIVENLIFLLFRDLGGSYFLCGVSVVVTVVFEIPLFYCSKDLLERLGAPALICIAGLCYSFRAVGYTLCPGGWYVLLFEPMHGVTIATSSAASVELVASITPDELIATGQALFSFAKSLGSTAGNGIGGAIIREYGESTCYRVSAVIVLFGLCIYCLALLIDRKRRTASKITQDDEVGVVLPVTVGQPDDPSDSAAV
jgi:MFS family permease